MSSIDLWYTTRATGLVALLLLTGTVFLGILTAGRARTKLPAFARAEVHRRAAALAVVFLAVHVLTAVLDTYVNIGWPAIVVPFASGYRTVWLALGTIGADLLLAVAISSARRQRISARHWRALHWLAYLSWPVAVSHALGMGTDSKLTWALGLVAVCIASVVAAATWRVVGALRARSAWPRTVIRPRSSIRSRVTGAAPGTGAGPWAPR
jgi:methionine sulfoxide reductase heme-binding subunit